MNEISDGEKHEKINKKDELRYKGIEFLQMSSWQRSDAQHVGGSGALGYRAVYKTLKLIPFPTINLVWQNLKISMSVERVEYGGIDVKGTAIPSIFPNRLLLPEYIDIQRENGLINFVGNTNLKFDFSPYENEFPVSGIVEALLEIDNPHDDILAQGRRHLAPTLTILDFVFGERLIGALITEEIIEIFPDGHWNRKAVSPLVGSESQLDMKGIQSDQIELMKKSIDTYMNLEAQDRENIALAADWFWKSERESDQVDKFIQLWVCIEALEMPSTDIKPISRQLANITNEDYNFWQEPIGRLFGKRSSLVHGDSNQIDEYEVITLRYIARLLLANRLGEIEKQSLTQDVIALVKLNYKKTNN